MKHDLDRFIEETSVCLKQVRENLDESLLEANTEEQLIRLLLTTDFHLVFIKQLVDNLKQLDKIPYLTDYLELIYNDHNTKSDVKAPVIIEAEFIIANTKPSERETTQLALKKMVDLESEVRGIYKGKLQKLRATHVPNDDELPTKNEIDMLTETLWMMIYDEKIDNPLKLIMLRATCPVYAIINKISMALNLLEQIISPDIAPETRDIIYYKNRNSRLIDLEKNLLHTVKLLWTAVTEVKIENTERDAEHARAIVERLAKIQYLILKKFQVNIHEIHMEQTAEFEKIGLDGLQKELISRREKFKAYTPEVDHVSLFANPSEVPFYRRVSESLILLKRLIRLKDPELVTEGDKSVAQEKYQELKDPKILIKYREELESILPKVKPEHKTEMIPEFFRLVLIVQYAALEMKNYLKESELEATYQGVLGDGHHLALTDVTATRQLALTP